MADTANQVDALVDNKILTAIGRIASPILLTAAVPAFLWVTSSISELQRTVAVLSDRVAQMSPPYRPADALRDQALIAEQLAAIRERMVRGDKRGDDQDKRIGDLERRTTGGRQ